MTMLPFITCICVTRNRRFFLRRAVHYFERACSAYPGQCELVIVDGSAEPNPEWQNSHHRYIHHPQIAWEPMGESPIGVVTNIACDAARGDVILKWDDDDWHAPHRIDLYAEEALKYEEAIFYTARLYWYHLQMRSGCVGHGAGGGTLAFHKSVWQKEPFVEKGVEDTPFCAHHKAHGVSMVDLQNSESYVYIRHRMNTSPNTSYGLGAEETRICRDLFKGTGDLDYYDELSEIIPLEPWNHPNSFASRMHVLNPLQLQWARHFR